MIICLCYGISYRDIVKLIKEGKSTDEITLECGAGSRCGACIKTIQEEIDKYKNKQLTNSSLD